MSQKNEPGRWLLDVVCDSVDKRGGCTRWDNHPPHRDFYARRQEEIIDQAGPLVGGDEARVRAVVETIARVIF